MEKNYRPKGRPFVSVFFECCKIYSRIYKNKANTHYVGWCPRCTKKVSLKIGPGGTDNRMFIAN